MNKIESSIIKLMEVLYKINEDEKEKLIQSFSESSESNKKEVLKVLIKAYKKYENSLQTLLNKIKKVNIETSEYQEHLNVDDILKQID